MDLPLLQMLQAMKRVETNPSVQENFKMKVIDLATFIPMYSNVMIVDQRATGIGDKKPYRPKMSLSTADAVSGPVKKEFLTNSVTRALISIRHRRSLSSLEGGWTIILKEGLYIDAPLFYKGADSPPMQIVGLNDVRLLFTGPRCRRDNAAIWVESTKLALENVRIYDFWKDQAKVTTIGSSWGAQLTLSNVAIHAPHKDALYIRDKGSCISLSHSLVFGCYSTVMIEGGAQMRLDNCSIVDNRFKGLGVRQSKIVAIKTRFINHYCFAVGVGSHCFLDSCQFEQNERLSIKGVLDNDETLGNCLHIVDSKLTCGGSTFLGFKRVVELCGSDCQALLNACHVEVTEDVATVTSNASFTACDNFISSAEKSLLAICLNVEGRVRFIRNALAPSVRPRMHIDDVSKEPEHDLENIIVAPFNVTIGGYTDTERSSYTKYVQKMGKSERFDLSLIRRHGLYKSCAKCLNFENNDALNKWNVGEKAEVTEKYRYCGRCRLVSYCSDECQSAHWQEHRIICGSIVKI